MSFLLALRNALLTGLLLSLSATAQTPRYFSVPAPDAPELAHRGQFSVGVRTLEIVQKNHPDVLAVHNIADHAPLTDRHLKLEAWYPAAIPAGQQERTVYTSAMAGRPDRQPQGTPATFQVEGKCLRDAPPLTGQTFPLVIVSHGYPGSRIFLSYLTENLASKGYVVVAIDHTDSVFGEIKPFPSTLLNRANDQLFTLESVKLLSHDPSSFLNGLADTTHTAIIGYSMGGYGALTSAGAGFARNSMVANMISKDLVGEWMAGDPRYAAHYPKDLKAVVAIAPWGEQPPINSWDESGLAGIHIPSLFIAGDHDDVANYEQGIRPAYERAVHSDRCMLVYENARHNTGGNPAPPEALSSYPLMQSFEEPVWRKDRITAINQHFITAFLDLYLKGETDKRAYLHVQPERSDDGVWPVAIGQGDMGAFSGGTSPDNKPFWKGFQQRWALGLEMHCAASK